MFRKPCPVIEKKISSTSRNSHDHPLLTISSGLRGVFPGWLWFASGRATSGTFIDFSCAGGKKPPACELATLIDGGLRSGVIHIGLVDDDITCSDALLNGTGFTSQSVHSVLDGGATHVSRFLGNDQVDHAVIEVSDSPLRRIKIRDLDLPLLIGILDGLGCSLGAEQVGAKDATDLCSLAAGQQRRDLL